jgi:hypothetical protein
MEEKTRLHFPTGRRRTLALFRSDHKCRGLDQSHAHSFGQLIENYIHAPGTYAVSRGCQVSQRRPQMTSFGPLPDLSSRNPEQARNTRGGGGGLGNPTQARLARVRTIAEICTKSRRLSFHPEISPMSQPQKAQHPKIEKPSIVFCGCQQDHRALRYHFVESCS